MTRGPAILDINRELLRLVLDEWRAVESPCRLRGLRSLSWNAWTCRWTQCGDSVASGADWLLAGDNHARNGTASFTELEWE